MTFRHLFHRLVVLPALLAAMDAAAAPAPVVKTIYPDPNGGVGGLYTLAVLADGYPDGSEGQFDEDAANIINFDLMADQFYANLGPRLTIKTVFQPTPSSQTSLFGITVTGGILNCYIATQPPTPTDPGTDSRVEDMVGATVPTARHTIILKNDNSMVGCTHQRSWTLVTSGNVNRTGTLQHELGHLIGGLHDEYVLTQQAAVDYPKPPVFGPNCSTDHQGAWWLGATVPTSLAPPGTYEGCWEYGKKIWRPYTMCRMRGPASDFCNVCALEMEGSVLALKLPALVDTEKPAPQGRRPVQRRSEAGVPRLLPVAYGDQTPRGPVAAPALSQNRSVRMLLAVNAQTHRIRVVRATDVDAPALQQYRRSGDYVYAINENGQTIETGTIPGDPFEDHAFGGNAAPHVTTSGPTATIAVFIPGSSRRDLLTRNIAVTLYRIRVADRTDITPSQFDTLRAGNRLVEVARLSPDDLKGSLR